MNKLITLTSAKQLTKTEMKKLSGGGHTYSYVGCGELYPTYRICRTECPTGPCNRVDFV